MWAHRTSSHDYLRLLLEGAESRHQLNLCLDFLSIEEALEHAEDSLRAPLSHKRIREHKRREVEHES